MNQVGESYNRAYKVMVKVQQLVEMEEVIEYKSTDVGERKAVIREIWTKRLRGCQRNVEVWQDMLAIHSMAIPPVEDVDNWLMFSSLCRKSGLMRLSHKTLVGLLGCPEPASGDDVSALLVNTSSPPGCAVLSRNAMNVIKKLTFHAAQGHFQLFEAYLRRGRQEGRL